MFKIMKAHAFYIILTACCLAVVLVALWFIGENAVSSLRKFATIGWRPSNGNPMVLLAVAGYMAMVLVYLATESAFRTYIEAKKSDRRVIARSIIAGFVVAVICVVIEVIVIIHRKVYLLTQWGGEEELPYYDTVLSIFSSFGTDLYFNVQLFFFTLSLAVILNGFTCLRDDARKQNIRKGRERERLKIARKMNSLSLPLTTIAQSIEMSADETQELLQATEKPKEQT